MKLGTLNYSNRTEEGYVKFDKTVDLTNPDVVMLDILHDWIISLTNTYNDLLAVTLPTEDN